jgi:hypothetical protein
VLLPALLAMADDFGGKQGLDRRRFFQSAADMAAERGLWAAVRGEQGGSRHPAMAQERAAALKDQFIMEMHTHFLREDTRIMEAPGAIRLGAKPADFPIPPTEVRGPRTQARLSWRPRHTPKSNYGWHAYPDLVTAMVAPET